MEEKNTINDWKLEEQRKETQCMLNNYKVQWRKTDPKGKF